MPASFKLAKAFLNGLNLLVSKSFAGPLLLENLLERVIFTAD
jgi:hypothetical protein